MPNDRRACLPLRRSNGFHGASRNHRKLSENRAVIALRSGEGHDRRRVLRTRLRFRVGSCSILVIVCGWNNPVTARPGWTMRGPENGRMPPALHETLSNSAARGGNQHGQGSNSDSRPAEVQKGLARGLCRPARSRSVGPEGKGHDGSCAHAALEIESGKARNAHFGGKHSGRRNSLPWPGAATDNCRAIGS